MRWLKKISFWFLPQLVEWYVSKDRWFRFEKLKIKVAAGVFHPGLFFTTHILLRRLLKEKLSGKTILELGAGSGLIAMVAATRGANSWASDISPKVIENLRFNSQANQLNVNIIESDLFDQIPKDQVFDFIIINPPFYPKKPNSMAGRAWFCGENFEYFQKLFQQLPQRNYGQTWMILSEDCDLERIKSLATKNDMQMEILEKITNFWETNHIFNLVKTPVSGKKS